MLLRSSQAQEVPNNGGGQGWRRLGQQYQGSLGPRDGGRPEVVPPDGEGKSWSVLSRLKHRGVNIAFYHLRCLGRRTAVLRGAGHAPWGENSRWEHSQRRGTASGATTTITPEGRRAAPVRDSHTQLATSRRDPNAASVAERRARGPSGASSLLKAARGSGQRGRAAGRAAGRCCGALDGMALCRRRRFGLRGRAGWAYSIPGAAGLRRRCSSVAH